MALFRYEAVDRAGKVVMGAMDASDEASVGTRLAQMGYQVQQVIPPRAAASPRTGSRPAQGASQQAQPVDMSVRGAKPAQMAVFFRQLASLARAGISIYQGLDNLAPRIGHRGLSRTASEMAQAAQGGGRISDVMARYPRLFPPHVVGAVRAGELGGFLPVMFDEVAQTYEDEVTFYRWMWLPIAFAVQAVLIFPFILPLRSLWPEPKFGLYFSQVFLLWVPIFLGAMAAIWLGARWLKTPGQLERHDAIALRAPVFGDLVRQTALVSFVRSLSRLYQAGVGPIYAWEGAMNVVPNAVIRSKLAEAYALMETGNVPLHDAFAATGLFANEMEQLLATGVVSGQVVDMLDRVTAYYQENVDRARKTSQFWMYRLGCLVTLVATGAAVIVITWIYFHGTMDFIKTFETD